jgi:hypothetical protein
VLALLSTRHGLHVHTFDRQLYSSLFAHVFDGYFKVGQVVYSVDTIDLLLFGLFVHVSAALFEQVFGFFCDLLFGHCDYMGGLWAILVQ